LVSHTLRLQQFDDLPIKAGFPEPGLIDRLLLPRKSRINATARCFPEADSNEKLKGKRLMTFYFDPMHSFLFVEYIRLFSSNTFNAARDPRHAVQLAQDAQLHSICAMKLQP